MKIGVFDSGIGGEAVAHQLESLIPDAEVITVNDHEHVPYGSRPAEEIIELTDTAIQPLFDAQCNVIVIACNTATTVAISTLRERHPDMPFVGIEPMVKPAAQLTKTKHITVLATPATLASHRYQSLKEEWAQGVTIDEPDCSTWASLIEDGHANKIPIETFVEHAIANGSDVIVLGCTHYHWLEERAAQTAAGRAQILEPSDAISRRIASITEVA